MCHDSYFIPEELQTGTIHLYSDSLAAPRRHMLNLCSFPSQLHDLYTDTHNLVFMTIAAILISEAEKSEGPSASHWGLTQGRGVERSLFNKIICKKK